MNHSKVKYIIAAACRAGYYFIAAGKESFHSNNARVHSQEKALRTHTDLENFITHLSLSLRAYKKSLMLWEFGRHNADDWLLFNA